MPVRFIEAHSGADLLAQLRGAPPAPLPEGGARWLRVGVILEDEEGAAEVRTTWRHLASALDYAMTVDEAMGARASQPAGRACLRQREAAARWGVAPSRIFVEQ